MGTTKAVLIIGGSGFIGTHLALKLREGYKVFATYHSRPMSIPGVTFLPLNVSNQNWAKRIAYTAQPEVVIYVAGSNNTEFAESRPREAERIHAGGPATVSNASEIFQSKFIYLSNCYVFDGHRGNYRESDTVLPSISLGKAKLSGENYVRGRSLNYLIVRSSPVYGRGNGWRLSFLDHLRMLLDRKQRIEFGGTELHSYAPISGLAELLARLVESGPRNKTFHYGGLTKISAYEFARNFAKRFAYNPELILQSGQIQKNEAGPRKTINENTPPDFSLNCSQVTETLKIKPLLLEEGFDLLKKELIPSF